MSNILDEAKRAAVCVHLAAEASVADDLARILRGCVAEIEHLRGALTSIADFDDALANAHLEKHGSYGGFDEPGSVKTARAALKSAKE